MSSTSRCADVTVLKASSALRPRIGAATIARPISSALRHDCPPSRATRRSGTAGSDAAVRGEFAAHPLNAALSDHVGAWAVAGAPTWA